MADSWFINPGAPLGLGNLTDPGADRLLFWDDSAGSLQWLAAGTGLTITGTTLTATPGGSDTQVGFNDGGVWGFDAGLVYNKTTDALTVAGIVSVGGSVIAQGSTLIPAGGTAGAGYLFSSTTNYGVFFGSGAPTLSAAQGSLYLRSNGTPYYNTNGTTGWSAVGTITGSDTQVLFFNGANTPAGDAGFTYNPSNDTLTVTANITATSAFIGPIWAHGSQGVVRWPGNGTFHISNNAETGFNRLILGTNDTSGVSLVKSTTILKARLGDDSADAAFTASLVTASTGITMSVAAPLSITSGTNQRAGNLTLVAGTLAVSNTTVTANSIVLLTRKTAGGVLGTAITYTLSAGTSFTVNSDNPADTSTFSYTIVEVP